MTDTTQASGGLSPEVIETFARGLFHLANVDGMDEREEQLIREFLEETGSDLKFEDLKGGEFSPLDAALTLPTTHMRRVFVKAAVAMVKADGVYSDAERKAIGELADAFEMNNAEFGDLEQHANDVSLTD